MPRIYCGNNALYKKSRRGTRHECFLQGFGLGYYKLPVNLDYSGKYVPIDKRVMYCGNKRFLPPGYHLKGNLPQCHSKGVGVGMRKRANEHNKSRKKPRKKSVKKSRKKPRKKSVKKSKVKSRKKRN